MNKTLYKIELWMIKVIPMIIAALYLLNTLLSYFYIDVSVLSYIGGLSLLPLLFLYISSFVFKFCIYHRMFLYYIITCDIINYIDYHIGIPVSDRGYLLMHLSVAGMFLFLIIYLKIKLCRH